MRPYKPQTHSDEMTIDVLDEVKDIIKHHADDLPYVVKVSLISRLNAVERRMKNAVDTIGEYQRLTESDYPGTFHSQIEAGKWVKTRE